MADDPKAPEPFSLSRWSRRKHEVARGATPASTAPATAAAQSATIVPAPTADAAADAPLPPVESLNIDSDFSVFMQPKVDEDVKRAALKKLFSDSRFNVMDGLDIYTGDYTQADPMPAGMLAKLANVYTSLASDAQPTTAAGEQVSDASVDAPAADATPPRFAPSDDAVSETPANVDVASPAIVDAQHAQARKPT